MTANIEIATAARENALLLPANAVQEADGKKSVAVWEGKETKQKEVEVGLEGRGGVLEILSGVSEGEQAIIQTKVK